MTGISGTTPSDQGWSAALDAFEADLDALETALAEQAWDDLPRTDGPGTPADAPTPSEQARAAALLRRAAPLEERMRQAMQALDNELAGLSVKRQAATSYAQLGGPAAEPPPPA